MRKSLLLLVCLWSHHFTLWFQVLTVIGNFCICSIAIGMLIEIIIIYWVQHRHYHSGIGNLVVLLIGGIPIAIPAVVSLIMSVGFRHLTQQVCEAVIDTTFWNCAFALKFLQKLFK